MKFYHIIVIFSGIVASILNAMTGNYSSAVWPILTATCCIMHAFK